MNTKLTYYMGFTISVRFHRDIKEVIITDAHTKESHILELKAMSEGDFDALEFAKSYVDLLLLNDNAMS